MVQIEDLGMININGKNRRFGIYKCSDCGAEKRQRVDSAKVRKTTACIKCSSRHRNTYHGDTNSKLYGVWGSLKYRATTNKVKGYENISMSAEWEEWGAFKEWATISGYKEGLSIDRIDNNGNYTPNNCRWTNRFVQNQNQGLLSLVNTSGYRGVYGYKDREYYYANVSNNNRRVNLGKFYDKIEAAKAYDMYVVANGLSQPTNFNRSNYE
jgi:hypothetical protein